jgi:thioredoxin-related protein
MMMMVMKKRRRRTRVLMMQNENKCHYCGNVIKDFASATLRPPP